MTPNARVTVSPIRKKAAMESPTPHAIQIERFTGFGMGSRAEVLARIRRRERVYHRRLGIDVVR
jgi:hypothetical protein